MGSDLAPLGTLYYFGNKWILNLLNSKLYKARNLVNAFCFIDDLCAINEHSKEMCLEELDLNKKTFLILRLYCSKNKRN